MAVNLEPANTKKLLAIDGVRLGVAEAGVRKAKHKDLTVFLLDAGCSVGGVFTQNRYCAAPVQVCQAHLTHQHPPNIRALVINTGIANAGTGAQGMQAAHKTCAALASALNLAAHEILPFSTGVIMEQLPVDKIIAALPQAIANTQSEQSNTWAQAASAIMTTDTVAKAASSQIDIENQPVRITGISKGSGMICPNMATMLGFITTDASIAPEIMPQLTRAVADASFNRITVDGDTSTNDSFILIASNKAQNTPIDNLNTPAGQTLLTGLIEIAQELAQAIVRDGEGASKFISITVEGGKTSAECRQVAYSVAHSPLVKTAFFASDPNLGRILAAIGYAGISDLNPEQIELFLDNIHVITQGAAAPSYTEAQGQRVMQQDEINIRIGLGRGSATDTIWTCDFSYEYVRINADYRS